MPAFNRFNAWTDTMVEAANCGTDQFAIALTNTAPSASNTVLADITQIAYTGFGSRNLTTTSSSQTGGVYSLVWGSLTLGTTVTSATFRYVVIYDDTLAGDPLVGWYDLGVGTTIPANTSLILSGMGLDLDGSSFDPLELFSGGEQGAWYDPSDLSTMFQDTAGTIPVTADGQNVARINDKSGRNNHALQATTSLQPLYKTDGTKHWLLTDGVDDLIRSAAGSDTLGVPLFMAEAMEVLVTGITTNHSSASVNANNHATLGNTTANRARAQIRETTLGLVAIDQTTGTLTAGNHVLCSQFDVGTMDAQVDGATPQSVATSWTGSEAIANVRYGLQGSAGNAASNHKCFGLVVVKKSLSAGERTSINTWLGAKAGLTI